MTTEEIIAIISQQLNRQFDVAFHREIMTRFTLWRARLLKDSLQTVQNRKFYRQTIYDDLEITKLPGYKLETRDNFKVLKTKQRIPKLIRANNILFDFIGSFDRTISYGFIDSHRIPYLQYSRYSPNNKFFYLDDYAYILSDEEPDEVAIEAIFADPRDLIVYTNPDNQPCYKDSNYPVDAALAQRAAEYVVKYDLRNMYPQTQEVTIGNERVQS